ncbi:MAG TPA: FAD-binding protein, partial [Thermoanaerobaculia bacterium]
MKEDVSRRNFLRGTLTAVAVAGFDVHLRGWVSAAELASGRATLADAFPHFRGQLHFDDASLTAAADDFGHAIHRRPLAVLKPAAVSDVVRLLQFTSRHGIQVAARGQGHSTLGQAQVAAGVVIDLSTLAAIHEVNDHDALVDAGVRWSELLRQTLPKGIAPTVFNDYIELSVGGTLSVGGVGSQSFRRGAQVDNVLELTVVTGRGELMTCSPSRHRQLFDAVRSGLGQFGVIVQARVRLVPALPKTRYYKLTYDDLSVFLADLRLLVQDGRFDTVQGFVNVLTAARIPGWDYTIEATKNFSPRHEPDDAALLAGLSPSV